MLKGIEESIFCRIIKRLVSEKMATEDAYKELVTKKTCFDVTRRLRRAAVCSGNNERINVLTIFCFIVLLYIALIKTVLYF